MPDQRIENITCVWTSIIGCSKSNIYPGYFLFFPRVKCSGFFCVQPPCCQCDDGQRGINVQRFLLVISKHNNSSFRYLYRPDSPRWSGWAWAGRAGGATAPSPRIWRSSCRGKPRSWQRKKHHTPFVIRPTSRYGLMGFYVFCNTRTSSRRIL